VLAHFFEDEGLPTTQISLIRIHTEKTLPPRALWVPFELGRPLGAPNDAAFQKRVLLAALRLLEAPAGPVIEDFPEDAPASPEAITALACPVNFAQERADLSETGQLCAAFKSEMASLRPWYDLAVENHGRTTAGTSGLAVDALADYVCSFLGDTPPENPLPDMHPGFALKLAAEDLKAYYFEGITAQPSQSAASSEVLSDWFWGETVAGKALLAVKGACGNSEDGLMKVVGRGLIVPSKVARAQAA
jgi:hypothetical protein